MPRILAALAMLASAARAQPVWDGATKPRVESSQGNLVFNAHADVTVNLAGRGAAGQGRSLWSLISHQDTSVASGCEIGQVVAGILADGTLQCVESPSQVYVENVNDAIASVRGALPTVCQLSAWSEYGACDAACEGKRTRTRTIRTEAVNSVPCNEFRLNESIPCGPVCKEDFCGDNEKWFFLNSGDQYAYVASYTTQKVIVRRESERYEAGGQGHGYSRVIAAGRTLTINPRSIGFWQWQAGDYMCGTSGGIEVFGRRGSYEREWAPARMAGTEFAFPVTRANQQHVQFMATQRTTVDYYRGNAHQYSNELGAGEVGRFQDSRSGRNFRFNSSAPIIVTTTAGAPTRSTLYLAPRYTGNTDFFIVHPTAATLYGIPASGYVSAAAAGTTPVVISCWGRPARTVTIAGPDRFQRIGGQISGPPCFVSTQANIPLSAASMGDGDGSNGVSWVSRDKFRRQWVSPIPSQHAAFVCAGAGRITLRRRMDLAAGQITLNIVFRNGVGKAYTTNGAILRRTGWYASSTVDCALTIDGVRAGHESMLFGQPAAN